jgi:hypothetical protein
MELINAMLRTHVVSSKRGCTAGIVAAILLVFGNAFTSGQGSRIPEPPLLPGQKPFNLTLEETRRYSQSKNFEVVGHSYFKGEWVLPSARERGMGCGFNTPRVSKGIGYFAGYDEPPTCFGVLIADVSNPADMKVLSFVPCNAGTRCNYIRLNTQRKILVVGMDTSQKNPSRPTGGSGAQAGVSFYDISDPRTPRLLGSFLSLANGATHGFEIDDRYVYGCARMAQTKPGDQELVIIDYNDARRPTLVSTVHIQGQRFGETYEPRDQKNLDGSPQHIWCHEVNYHKDRLYVAWRDAGMVIVDVRDRSKPSIISRLKYVPPFNGGQSGATHTAAPVVVDADKHPTLVVLTDEIIDCPPGFGRIVDISDLSNPQVIATLRIPHITDNYDFATGKFRCPSNGGYTHHPWFDLRSPSLLYVAWIEQGLRVWDISNPFLPQEVGYYLSPRYPGRFPNRQVREVYQDPDTALTYMADANGAGITVLRWVGPIPPRPPLPSVLPGGR